MPAFETPSSAPTLVLLAVKPALVLLAVKPGGVFVCHSARGWAAAIYAPITNEMVEVRTDEEPVPLGRRTAAPWGRTSSG
jgi:hypothetical protein